MFLSMKADLNNFGVRMTLLNMMLMVKVWYFSSLLDGHILPSRYTYAAPYEGVVQCVAIKSESRVKRKKNVGGIEMGFAKFTTLIASRLSCF